MMFIPLFVIGVMVLALVIIVMTAPLWARSGSALWKLLGNQMKEAGETIDESLAPTNSSEEKN